MKVIHNKPWYIWLSFLAFAILWGDTVWRIKFLGENWVDFWGLALLNFFKIAFFSTFPIALMAWMFDLSLPIPELSERTLAHELAAAVQLLVAYIFGVYAAYKHHVWRQENISHLLIKKSPARDSGDDEKKT